MTGLSPSCEFDFLAARARSEHLAAHALFMLRLCGSENSHSFAMRRATSRMQKFLILQRPKTLLKWCCAFLLLNSTILQQGFAHRILGLTTRTKTVPAMKDRDYSDLCNFTLPLSVAQPDVCARAFCNSNPVRSGTVVRPSASCEATMAAFRRAP